MSRRVAIVGLCAAMLGVAAPAYGRVIDAGSVLPPGQSGFVSVTGVANGTGSPHLNDQTDLFVHFGFKPDVFDPVGESVEDPRPGVHIIRDHYGVPDVHGTTINDVWWGAGYAMAQDRLFQMEIFRRAAEGRLAEILGKSYLPMDIETRRDFYTPAELDAQFARLPQDVQQTFLAYRDGVNAWIAQTRNDPSKLPGEYVALGVGQPADWTLEDSVAVGVYLARTIPSGSGAELDNLRAFQAMGPGMFNKVLPVHTKHPVITVPRSSGRFPSSPGRTRRQESAAYKRTIPFARSLPLPAANDQGVEAATARRLPLLGHVGLPEGSDVWAIRGPHHQATLFTGPQLGYSIPELLVELEVHGPGLDARGVTAAGVPVVGIGHNDHVAWGLTSGESDDDDLYAEQMVDADHYRYKGQTLALDCRTESFSYKPPPTAATDLGPLLGQVLSPGGGAGTQGERICRSVHGPIVARAGNVAYARRFAIWNREADTIVGLDMLDRARSIKDVDRAMRHVTWNENCTAADDRGHIGYWHPGLLPLKPKGWDERLPYPGDGSAEWRGFLPVKARPHAIDPKQGYLFNWNNKPSLDWTEGDALSRYREEGPFHHANIVGRNVRRVARGGFGYQQTAAVDRITGTVAQQRSPAQSLLKAARRGATGPAAAVLDAILAWNGSYNETDANGTLAPGAAAWKQLEYAAMNRTLGGYPDDVKKALDIVPSSDFDSNLGELYGLTHLGPAGLRAAATDAAGLLTQQFHSSDPSAWRMPRPFEEPTAMGAGSFPPFPKFDRGTWQQVVLLGP